MDKFGLWTDFRISQGNAARSSNEKKRKEKKEKHCCTGTYLQSCLVIYEQHFDEVHSHGLYTLTLEHSQGNEAIVLMKKKEKKRNLTSMPGIHFHVFAY